MVWPHRDPKRTGTCNQVTPLINGLHRYLTGKLSSSEELGTALALVDIGRGSGAKGESDVSVGTCVVNVVGRGVSIRTI